MPSLIPACGSEPGLQGLWTVVFRSAPSVVRQPNPSPGERLHAWLQSDFPVAPGCYDALSAKIAVRAGFTAVHVSGYAVAASQYGLPDLGLLGMRDMLSQASRVVQAVDVPAICDVDTGFGGINAVVETIRAFEQIGAGGVHIEDQAEPKRCPALDGRRVTSTEAFAHKLAVVQETRRDPSFMVIARTDADEVSFDELVRRCRAYLDAGADMVMPMLVKVDGVRTETLPPAEQMEWHRRLVGKVEGPVLGIAIPRGYTISDMRDAGYAAMLFTLLSLRSASNAVATALRMARHDGTAAAYTEAQTGELQNHPDMMDLLDLPALEKRDRRYAAVQDATSPSG
jgi:2-methylisocitrate lyase-like PEP mutase family enzyme